MNMLRHSRRPQGALFTMRLQTVAVVMVACSATALFGAARPTPAPRPAPTPHATPTPSPKPTPAPIPIVIVYPFDVSSDMKPDTGVRASQLFVAQMNAAGGIEAIEAPATVRRVDYLKYASGRNADYYVAGYMTPLGQGVSLVEQVVSSQSGAIVFGNTAQIESFEDAASQAITIHDGIIARERSLHAALSANEAQATPAPLPSNQANLSGFAGGLFRHRGRPVSAPHATPAVKPAKAVIVPRVTGQPAGVLQEATTRLLYALQSYYTVKPIALSGVQAARDADRVCGTDRNNTIAAGSIGAQPVRHGIFTRTQYAFTLDVYTCFGARLAQTTGSGDSAASAIAAAVQAYVQAHPSNQ